MIENRLTLIGAIIVVVIIGGAVLYKTNLPEPELEETHTIDVTTISQERLETTALITETLIEGDGEIAELGDTVSMQYVGVLTDGTQFDSSYERGTPFEFTLGEGSVITGWDQGVPGMKVGEKRRLIIPGDLAYGSDGRPNIPADATLIFDVVLEGIV